MLTKLILRNFKLFSEAEIDLGQRVVFIGPNNSGKTSALQAISLWDVGVKRWLEKRGVESTATERVEVSINRQDLISLPVPSAKLLWRHLRVRKGERIENKPLTRNVRIEIGVETNFHLLADFVPPEAIDDEIRRALDAIYEVASQAAA